ncbi:MAG: VCBS repeat-containing protein [Myxococcota bacterium]|nr:VCBS repeat-containing protein [Myxococcota bacterium]
MLWDIHGGLWGVDGDGVLRLTDGARILRKVTPLSALGPTTPMPADIADDLDGDGVAEVMAYSRGRLWVVSADGTERGSIPAPATGELSSRSRSGGSAVISSAALPPVVIGDLDGDGIRDLLLPTGRTLTAHLTGDVVGADKRQIRLPIDLDPRKEAGKKGPKQELAGAWFSDLDGDGRLDLATHLWVTEGSWFGATAQFRIFSGTGSAFSPLQTMQTDNAAVDVRFLDFDGDGDQDLLVSQVDIGLGNLGRALLSRQVQVEVGLYTMDGGRYPSQPRTLRTLTFPIERTDDLQLALEGDIDGDGLIDLVTNDGGDWLRVYRNELTAFSEEPLASIAMPIPRVDDALFVHDLTGDGRAEIFVWEPGASEGTLLRLKSP